MKTFTVDLCVASLPMRLVAIGFVKDLKYQMSHMFQHRHSLFEMQYVTQGQCTVKIDRQVCTQSEGEVFLIAPGVYHSQKSCTSPFEKMCIIFEIPAPPPGSLNGARELFLSLSMSKCFSCSAEDMAPAFAALKLALKDWDTKVCGIDEIRVLTELLILRLIQHRSAPEDGNEEAAYAHEQRAYIIDEFFNCNFHLNDGDTALAKILGVSVRQLNRILKSLYGCNFREKLKEIRLEVATDLLAAGRSITEISEITGYSCPANFSTFIKNATGKTPSQLRKSISGNQQQTHNTLY